LEACEVESKLFSVDPVLGTETWHHYDPDKDTATLEVKQVVDRIYASNQEERDSYDSNARFGSWRKVASIPINVYWDLKRRGVIDDPKEFAKWLNRSDNRVFRTFDKTL